MLAKFVRFADGINDIVGRGIAWLTLAMVVVTFVVVVLRYVYSIGWVWLQESYVWMHGAVFMIGAGYTLLHNGHVRVDVIYRPASPRYKAIVDIIGAVVLLLPMLFLVAKVSFPYVIESWLKLEESREAGGLPGLFLLKTVIIIFCALLALQGLSVIARGILVLRGDPDFLPAKHGGKAL
jgi:TRAP-type mannitol/chloroaromatic compound transport system permease small subunit